MEYIGSHKALVLQKGVNALSLKNIVKEKFETLKTSKELYDSDLKSIYYDIDRIFSSLYNQKQEGSINLNTWHHIDTSTINNTWMTYGIARDELIDTTIQYLDEDNKWAQNQDLDWMLIDLLMFAEYIAIINEAYKYRFNTAEYHRLYKSNEHIPDNIKLKERFSGWLWLLMFISFLFIYIPVAVIIGIIFLIRLGINFFIIKELTKASSNAGIAYDSLITGDWQVVWDDLNYSRTKGIVWDKQVFELVQKNL